MEETKGKVTRHTKRKQAEQQGTKSKQTCKTNRLANKTKTTMQHETKQN